MKWIEIKVKTSTEAVEAVSNLFYEAGVAGLVIEDPKSYLASNREGDWDYVEIPAGIDFDEVVITGYIIEDSSAAERVQEIQNRVKELPSFGLDIGKGEVTLDTVSETDWAEAWKKYYKPTRIGAHIVIKPSWENYEPKPGDKVIELDPGMAFGTGTHETTVLCLELLEKHVKKDSVVIDIGCGSGILSVAAGMLGAAQVMGIDKDEVAVRVARENVKRNRLSSAIDILKGDKIEDAGIKGDIIVANIVADVIIEFCRQVPLYLKEGGIFLASGIIKDRKLSVKEALEKNGFDIIDEIEKGEWVALATTLALSQISV
jgi:ribosomal protein L11 methyltransferase